MLELLLPSLLPAVLDIAKSAAARLIGFKTDEPRSVEERIALMDADVRRLEALAKLDTPSGDISRWVADLRASARYILGFMILFITSLYVLAVPGANPEIANFLLQLTASVFAFFFGDRVYLRLRGKT